MDILNFSDQTLSLLSLIAVVLPLLTFVLVFAGAKRFGGPVSIFNIAVSFVCSLLIFLSLWNSNDEITHSHISWFTIGDHGFNAGILLNNLSVLMLVLVSGIALLVHIYSLAYMHGDPDIHKYWAYLGLFCFSMLGLVVSDSLLLIYMFWELVGFSSFLLIGFWFTKEAAAQAAKKAFIMNRIGDIGFLCGLMIIYAQFRTFDIVELFGNGGLVNSAQIVDGIWIGSGGQMPVLWLTVAGISFFLGAVAKSAQFPLHTWLPDAMEGPTSVSSLIHAATMVAAGVFLLGRVYPLFDSVALNVILATGVLTAFMAATIALTQNDIKRILAFSTISQLGFMVVAMGMGAYGESLFHLSTHAFFKCLLFLAAGAVIHQLHHYKDLHKLDFDHQDIRMMGGLKKEMPIAFMAMCIAAAALAGIPLTSGYLSKDAILVTSFEWAAGYHGFKKWVPYVLVLTSWLTVFYIARLIFKVFFGQAKHEGVHEAPAAMRGVLIVLAVFSLFVFFSFNPISYQGSWLLNGFADAGVKRLLNLHLTVPVVVNLGSIILIYVAYRIYGSGVKNEDREKGFLYRFSARGWYLNETYNLVFTRPAVLLAAFSYKFDKIVVDGLVNQLGNIIRLFSDISDWLDRHIVDGLVNRVGDLAKKTGDLSRKFQSGKVQHYLITMLTVVIVFFVLIYFV